MRFHADGPNIPDELLTARDEGRLIIICGAGVSRARANLPDFFGLLKAVMDDLRVSATHDSRKLAEQATELERVTGVRGLVTADRLFGLLERDFDNRAINAAVSQALRPTDNVDLSAHKIVLEIAKGIDGRVRLVTTNFDLLFEACDATLMRAAPPRLPDPTRFDDLAGITHLHGHVVDDYSDAAGDGFILSSAEFGRAYLSEAWATNFFRSLLGKYCVLFLGYGADDPPVQYLLEALNRSAGSSGEVYAFQSGTENEAAAIWRHRGVKSIPYNEANHHTELWTTLESWAIRATNPKSWLKNVIDIARAGPDVLPPHVRGQVAHIISTREGAREFASAFPPLPATWLCVFDHEIRYLKPGRIGKFSEQGTYFDPFNSYGLDSDPVPEKPNDHSKWEIPRGVWNGLIPNRLDTESVHDEGCAQLRGPWASHVGNMPSRLSHLGNWISQVASQPAAIWWAAGQTALHPRVQFLIQSDFHRNKNSEAGEIRRAWHYLFESWNALFKQKRIDDMLLRDGIALDGWSNVSVREYIRLYSPYVAVTQPWVGPRPPEADIIKWQDIIYASVKYPNPSVEIELPDTYLPLAIKELRRELELAVSLENELGGYGLESLPPFERDPDVDRESVNLFGLSRMVLFFVSLLRRLIARFPFETRREFLAWATNDDAIFARLRIWIAGHVGILPSADAEAVFIELKQKTFWGIRHQRDFLIALNNRWAELSDHGRSRIQKRIWRGPIRWRSEEKSDYRQRRAYAILDRVYWLKNLGHDLGPDFNEKVNCLKAHAPKWTEKDAAQASSSMEVRSGYIKHDTSYTALLTVPISEIIAEAEQLSRREHMLFVERDPFAGLAAEKPLIAMAALSRIATKGIYPKWAWEKLLSSEARSKDKPRLSLLIGERLGRIPLDQAVSISYSISSWLVTSAETLLRLHPKTFARVWEHILETLRYAESATASHVIRTTKTPDWAMEALNAPVGKLAETLMNDPVLTEAKEEAGLPKEWTQRAEELLALPGDARRHSIVIFVYKLSLFYYLDAEWTERQLLKIINQDNADCDAFWAGFFWSGTVPSQNLYHRLKPHLLKLAEHDTPIRRNHSNILSYVLLAGWGSADVNGRVVTDAEMHRVLASSDDDLRSSILWYLGRWTAEEGNWKDKKLEFLKVWPRERAARTATVTARLTDLAFDDPENFPTIVDAILPLLTPLNDNTHLFLGKRLPEREIDVIESYPEKVLTLLWLILPERIEIWPYGTPETLEKILKADYTLKLDPRYVELERRWNSR